MIIESSNCTNTSRYQLAAAGPSAELNVIELQAHLARLFPHIAVGGPPKEYAELIRKDGKPFGSPRGYSDLARHDLDLKTHPVDDSLFETGRTMIELGLVKPALR